LGSLIVFSPSFTFGAAATARRDARSGAAAPMSSRFLTVVFVAALAVRLVLVYASGGIGPRIVDEQHYHRLATSITRGDGFAWGPSQPTSIRPPLYPLFVAVIWKAVGTDSMQAVRVAQALLGTLSVWLLYLITARLFDRGTARIAALALAFYPSLLFSGVLLLTEVFFTTVLLAAMYGCLVLLEQRSRWAAVASGIAFGAAALTRSVMWPFPFVLVILLGLILGGAVRDRAKLCGLVLIGYVLVVAPWSIRNTLLQRTFTVVDTMGGLNLLTGNYEYTPEDRMWDGVSITGIRSWDEPLRYAPVPAGGWTEGAKDHWAQRRAVTFMLAHPVVTARRSLLKFADMWGLEREWVAGLQQRLYQPPTWFAIASSAAVLVAFPTVVLFAIAGLLLAPPADQRAHALLALLILFVCGIHSITFGHSRYHLPLMPVLMIYAAAAVRRRQELLGQLRRRVAIAPVFAMAVAIGIWGHEIFLRDFDRIAMLLRGWGPSG
jgi:4-amino-4-deoxy-L-arabinose transferase-like glycosyltransferase